LTDKTSYSQWTKYIWDAYGSISQLLIFSAVLSIHVDRQNDKTKLMCVNAVLQQVKREHCSEDGAMDQPEEKLNGENSHSQD
jgi:hypothetical protein